MRRSTRFFARIAAMVAMQAFTAVFASGVERSFVDGARVPGGVMHAYQSAPRRYLTREKKPVMLRFTLEWLVVDARRFDAATGRNVGQTSKRLAEAIEARLRDRIGSMDADAVSAGLSAVANEVIAWSRKQAFELGADVTHLRLLRL